MSPPVLPAPGSSTRAEGVSIRTLAAAARLSPARAHQITVAGTETTLQKTEPIILRVAGHLSADKCLLAKLVCQGHRGLVTAAGAVENFLEDKPWLTPAPKSAGMHLPLDVVRVRTSA